MKEEWSPVVGYEGFYEVSSIGRVRWVKPRVTEGDTSSNALKRLTLRYRNRKTKQYPNYTAGLSKNGKMRHVSVARMVAFAFLGPPPRGHQVNHKDGNPLNNVCTNLEWVTPKENAQHAVRMGLYRIGERHPDAKLTEDQVREARKEYLAGGVTKLALAKRCGVDSKTMGSLLSYKTWKHVK